MIEKILPECAVYSEDFGPPGDQGLFPEEAAVVAKAVASRRREFASGRNCARSALHRLGVAPRPILPGERGAPRWPAGIVGSITHCRGYCAAAVARNRDLLSLGIDAEPDEELPEGVLHLISLPGERAMLRALALATPGTCWDRLLFSAKEATYKAWFPLARRWLGFEDAEIAIDPAERTFGARLSVPATEAGDAIPRGMPQRFTGRWLASAGLVASVIAVPAPAP